MSLPPRATSSASRLASILPPGVLPALAVFSLVNLGAATIYTMFPLYLASLGMTPAGIGLLSSTSLVALAVGEGSWGWVSQRLGLRRSLVFSAALSALGALALAFLAHIAAIYFFYSLRSFAFATIFPASRSHLALSSAPGRRASALAVLEFVLLGSGSLGALLGGFAAQLWDYRAVFLASALLTSLATVLALATLRDAPPAATGATAGDSAPPSPFPWRPFALQGTVAACFFVALSASGTFLPVLAGTIQGLQPAQVGLLFTLGGLVGMALTIPLGHLADRVGRERALALGLLASIGSMLGLAFAVGFAPLLAANTLGRLSHAIFGPAGAARLSELVPRQRLTTAMGLYGFAEDVGVIIGPALGGAVWEPWGYRWTFLLAALIGLAGLALVPFLVPRRAPRPAPQP